MRSRVVSVLLAALLLQGTARAEPATAPAGMQHPYELSRTEPLFLGVELASAAAVLAGGLLLSRNPATRCSWCESNAFDEGVRSALLASVPRQAGARSDMAVIVVPVLTLGALTIPALSYGKSAHAAENLAIAASATGLAIGIANGTKALVARERPAEHHGVLYRTTAAEHPNERYVSFYSSHTTTAFVLASSATTLSYLRGYESAPYVAAVGGTLALGTGLLRISADMHWATDVLVGAVAGTAIGFALPFLVHGRRGGTQVMLIPLTTPDSLGLGATGTF